MPKGRPVGSKNKPRKAAVVAPEPILDVESVQALVREFQSLQEQQKAINELYTVHTQSIGTLTPEEFRLYVQGVEQLYEV